MLLEPKDHNYLGSLYVTEQGTGLAFMDLSTADFLATQLLGEDAWQKAVDELTRFAPRELILPDDVAGDLKLRLAKDWPGDWVSSPSDAWSFNCDYAQRLLL